MKAVRTGVLFYALYFSLPILLSVALFTTSTKDIRFNDYLQYYFPLRRLAYQLNSYLEVSWLKSVNIGNINLGRGDWLFYITRTDGNSYNDWLGVPAEQIREKWQAYFTKCTTHPYGFAAEFLFLSPPNKETVYPEQTGLSFQSMITREHGNYATVLNLLGEKFPANYVDVRATLVTGKQTAPTYFKDDTHWNSYGAYLAHVEIIKKINEILGTSFPILQTGPLVAKGGSGTDILKMFNGANEFIGYPLHPDTNRIPEIVQPCCELPTQTAPYYAAFNRPDGQKTVWFLGDSFREHLKPFLSQYFRTIVFMDYKAERRELMQLALKTYGPPDLIIQEVLERQLDNSIADDDCEPISDKPR